MLAKGIAVVWVLAQSGCFALAIGNTHEQLLTSAVVETRVTSQQADVDGSVCYVDNLEAVTVRKRLSETYFVGAVSEILLGGGASLFGRPWLYAGLPVLVDGLITLIYVKATNHKVVARSRWELSNNTAPCKR